MTTSRYKLIKEAQQLNMLDLFNNIINFFKEDYGLTTTIEQTDKRNFLVFVGDYTIKIKDPIDDAIAKSLLKEWNKLVSEDMKALRVDVTERGYKIVIYDEPEVELVDTREDDIFKTESRQSNKPINEATDPNVVLDDKFVWFFHITDMNDNILSQNIEGIDHAIDEFIKNPNATKLVAVPYIDPDPNNPNVNYVIANNPGPTIIFDRETMTKEEIDELEVL